MLATMGSIEENSHRMVAKVVAPSLPVRSHLQTWGRVDVVFTWNAGGAGCCIDPCPKTTTPNEGWYGGRCDLQQTGHVSGLGLGIFLLKFFRKV